MSREQFEKLHPVPEGVSWSDVLDMYACEFLAYQNAEKRQNALWQGFQAGAAYGSNQELTDILKLLDTAPGLPLDSCKPEELQAWTTAIKSVLVHIGAALKP